MPRSTGEIALTLLADRRWRRIAVWASVAFHIVLLSALSVWYINKRTADQRARAAAPVAAAERVELAKAPLPSPEVRPEQVQATLARAEEKFAEASTAEQLSELEKQAAKLETLATAESVAEIAEKFDEWIPTPQRASAPAAAPIAGEFDFDTAQIHDVQRITAADGGWNYRSILVDAQGRTFEVELDREQGEKTYATFESLKKFPLVEQVYRQIAMGLIDKALREAQPPPPAGQPAAEIDNRDPFDNTDSP